MDLKNSSALPHITVATVVKKASKFLLVKEKVNGQIVYNQPAGHLKCGESLTAAALRETFEETTWRIKITSLLGIYNYLSAANGVTYIRHCFIAEPIWQEPEAKLASDILDAVWLSIDEIIQKTAELRSPLVLTVLKDYVAGNSYPLSVIRDS